MPHFVFFGMISNTGTVRIVNLNVIQPENQSSDQISFFRRDTFFQFWIDSAYVLVLSTCGVIPTSKFGFMTIFGSEMGQEVNTIDLGSLWEAKTASVAESGTERAGVYLQLGWI